jgi:hypothetical protein
MSLFPISPTNGQTTVVNGITYTYNSAQSAWIITSTTSSGTFVVTGNINVSGPLQSGNLADAVGYKGTPINFKSTTYTLALSDIGSNISITTGGIVIPANSLVPFPIGSTIIIFNNSTNTQQISIISDTLRQSGTTNTGNGLLAANDVATLIKVAATVWVVSGNVNCGFTPAALFAGGGTGAWYDPSDFSTMFQDSAGTTPVTAVEQPVGRMLDKSGLGNRVTQTTSTSRPILRSRYNLLTFTEQFDDASWGKFNVTLAPTTATTDPLGGLTAEILTDNATNGRHVFEQSLSGELSATRVFSVYAKQNTLRYMVMSIPVSTDVNCYSAIFDLQTGVVSATKANGTGTVSATIQDVGNGWYRCSMTGIVASSGNSTFFTILGASDRPGFTGALNNNNIPTYAGTGQTLYFWGAQLLTAGDQTSTRGVYQRVAAATVYDTSNPVWRPYLDFDGVDDTLSTLTGIGISGNAAFSWWMGRTLRTTAETGTFGLGEINSGAGRAMGVIRSAGTSSVAYAGLSPFNWATDTLFDNLVYSYIKTPGPINTTSTLRRNGIDNAGTGNSGNTPNISNTSLFIGQWADFGSSRFNGRIYSLIILGRAATSAELVSTEFWVNSKIGAY